MVKITDKTDYSRFVRPTDEDEGIWLDHLEVHLVTHPAGQVKETHVHEPPQDHVITIRSGRMRWTVEGESLDAEPFELFIQALFGRHDRLRILVLGFARLPTG